MLSFANRYGELTLALATSALNVKDIHGKDIDDRHKFGLDVAEKIALITDNCGIQIGGFGITDCYVVVHETSHTAAVARIEWMNYVGGNPTEEIVAARRWTALDAV